MAPAPESAPAPAVVAAAAARRESVVDGVVQAEASSFDA